MPLCSIVDGFPWKGKGTRSHHHPQVTISFKENHLLTIFLRFQGTPKLRKFPFNVYTHPLSRPLTFRPAERRWVIRAHLALAHWTGPGRLDW